MSIPAFDEILFPIDYAPGTQGGPRYQNRVVSSDSGAEQRVQMWANAKLTYTIGYTANPNDMQAVVSFFRGRKGRMRGFRFRDWSDYTATMEPLVYNVSGIQLTRTYNDGVDPEVRNILKPSLGGPFTFYRNGTPESCTLNTSTGIVTGFTGTGGDTYAWSGTFDTPVRFDVDALNFTQDNVGRYMLESIPVVELLLNT